MPVDVASGDRYIGPPAVWVVFGQRVVHNWRRAVGELLDELGEFEHRVLLRVAEVHGLRVVTRHELLEPLDEVAHVHERARLVSVAVHLRV